MAEQAAAAPRPSRRAAAVLLHGRGADSEGMLALAQEFGQHDIAYEAPEAPDPGIRIRFSRRWSRTSRIWAMPWIWSELP
jgi:hypothetical protein